MPGPDRMIPETVVNSLLRSGFPFQTSILDVILSADWSIFASEYPWCERSGDDEFIDIVSRSGNIYLVIECKKSRDETLTFLDPLGLSQRESDYFRCPVVGLFGHRFRTRWFASGASYARQVFRRMQGIHCETIKVLPISPSSDFCVVGTEPAGKNSRILEKDASQVVRAADAFARDLHKELLRFRSKVTPGVVLPMIVTNAKIYTASYDPGDVCLQTGEFKELPTIGIQPAHWVRFLKAFQVDSSESIPHLEEILGTSSILHNADFWGPSGYNSMIGKRSVFVVTAEFLRDFLGVLDFSPADFRTARLHGFKRKR